MISMNVKQVYGEWYDTVSDNEIDSLYFKRSDWSKGGKG